MSRRAKSGSERTQRPAQTVIIASASSGSALEMFAARSATKGTSASTVLRAGRAMEVENVQTLCAQPEGTWSSKAL